MISYNSYAIRYTTWDPILSIFHSCIDSDIEFSIIVYAETSWFFHPDEGFQFELKTPSLHRHPKIVCFLMS